MRLIALALAAGCATAPVDAPPTGPVFALKNPGFEAESEPSRPCATGWSCAMHADPRSFRFFHDDRAPAGGRRSFCLEPATREPWALVTQAVPEPSFRGGRVRFSMAVRIDGAEGKGGGPWVLLRTREGRQVVEQNLVKGTRAWQRVAVEIAIPADTQIVEFGAILEGNGRLCLDDARVELLGAARGPV